MTTTERSPSPPPQKPIALTPGPRAERLITLYNGYLRSTLKAISYESFADCFPTIAQQASSSLKHMHSEFLSRLEKFALEEFQQILTERSVIPNLNALDDLILTASRLRSRSTSASPPIPPHTLPPPTIIATHLAPVQKQQQSQLNARLQTLQSQNASLMEGVEAQRREMGELLARLEGTVGDLERAGVVLGRDGGEGLSEEARGAEVVMGGV